MNNEQSIEEIEWLQARAARITASDVHKIFPKKGDGKGYRTYLRGKLHERLTGDVKEQVDFKQTAWGKEHEPVAVQRFEKKIGVKGIHYGVANPKFFDYGEHAGGSPDWEGGGMGADIKCPYDGANHIENLMLDAANFKEERWDYFCQLQMNMLIRSWKCAYFVSYDPRIIESKYQLAIVKVLPDPEWQTEFDTRLDAAVQLMDSILAKLDKGSAFLATHDKDLETVLIEGV